MRDYWFQNCSPSVAPDEPGQDPCDLEGRQGLQERVYEKPEIINL